MRKVSVPLQVDEAAVVMVLAEMGQLGVCVLDSDGAVARVNARFCEMLGTEPFMLEDRPWEELRTVPALEAIDIGALQRKDGKSLWSGRTEVGSAAATGDFEWLAWRRKGDSFPGRLVVIVRTGQAEAREVKLPAGRRLKRSSPAGAGASLTVDGDPAVPASVPSGLQGSDVGSDGHGD